MNTSSNSNFKLLLIGSRTDILSYFKKKFEAVKPNYLISIEVDTKQFLAKLDSYDHNFIISIFQESDSGGYEVEFILKEHGKYCTLFDFNMPILKNINYTTFCELFSDSINELIDYIEYSISKESNIQEKHTFTKISFDKNVPDEFLLLPKSFIEEEDPGKISKSERRLQAIFEMAPDAMAITSLSGKILQVNKAFCDITGLSREKHEGKYFLQLPFLKDSDISYYIKLFSSFFLKKGKPSAEFRWKATDGSVRYGEVTANLVKVGTFQREIISIARDITERKSNEEALKNSIKELASINHELDDYTYAVSHDLKAPLRTIKSFGTFLLEDYSDQLDDEGRMYLQRMMDATTHMKELIEDLLTISRIGRTNSELETVDLNEIMELIKLDLTSNLEENGGKIVWNKLPKMRIQRIWIRQLLMNLVSNGLKFNKSEEPAVWVTYSSTPNVHNFTVRDNGIGIDPKHHERIFKIFERLHTPKEYPGNGAGLTICKKIIDFFNGEIWIESNPGGGSTFHFSIPVHQPDPERELDAYFQSGELITEVGGNL